MKIFTSTHSAVVVQKDDRASAGRYTLKGESCKEHREYSTFQTVEQIEEPREQTHHYPVEVNLWPYEAREKEGRRGSVCFVSGFHSQSSVEFDRNLILMCNFVNKIPMKTKADQYCDMK